MATTEIVFKVANSIMPDVVNAIVHNHAIPCSDGVTPDFTKNQWAKEWLRRIIKTELKIYYEAMRDPLPEIQDNLIT